MEGYKFIDVERNSTSGRVDVRLESSDGVVEKVEVKGTRQLRMVHILQSILYQEEGDRVSVTALDETVEPAEWFIQPARMMIEEIADFIERYPEEASRIYNPTKELCSSCSRTECPHNRRRTLLEPPNLPVEVS
jgi:hypothetical protein